MKKEKIFEFDIDRPLTAAKKKAVEKHIEENAEKASASVSYQWDEEEDGVLHVAADPAQIEIRFAPKSVELYFAAPLWARMLFTEKKKAELKEEIETILRQAKFVAAKKST